MNADSGNRETTSIGVEVAAPVVVAVAIAAASSRGYSCSPRDGAVQRTTAGQRNQERALCHQRYWLLRISRKEAACYWSR